MLTAVLDATDLLAAHVETPTWTLDADTTTRLVQAAATLAASVAELDLRAISQAETMDLAGAAGMRGTAQWLARTTTLSQGAAHTKVRLAKAAAAHEPTRQALARGEVHVEQAAVICRSVDLLDDDETTVSADDKARAERHLLAEAADHDAKALAVLGGRLVEVLDPAGADAHEARLLEKQEQRARARTSFTMRDDGEGLTRGSFAMPSAQASMLKKALMALAAPKAKRARDGAGSYDWATPTPAKLGEAFVTYLERFPASRLPKIGGMSAAVVVVGDFKILLGEVKAARLDTGVRISHTEFIRMACEAGVIPVWMSTADGKAMSSAASTASTSPTSASPSSSSARPASTPAATPRGGSATSTTGSPGPRAVRPTSTTPCSSAPSTTIGHMPRVRVIRFGPRRPALTCLRCGLPRLPAVRTG